MVGKHHHFRFPNVLGKNTFSHSSGSGGSPVTQAQGFSWSRLGHPWDGPQNTNRRTNADVLNPKKNHFFHAFDASPKKKVRRSKVWTPTWSPTNFGFRPWVARASELSTEKPPFRKPKQSFAGRGPCPISGHLRPKEAPTAYTPGLCSWHAATLRCH